MLQMKNIIKLPGLIDIHVHLRDPGQTHKEDFYTGTSAAIAGGVTTVFDMPNNFEPIFTYAKLMQKIKIAQEKTVCDWGLYFGTNGKNIYEFEKVKDLVIGLKVYLSLTTGKYVINDDELVEKVFQKWPKIKILVVHAEGERVDLAIRLAHKYNNKLHITHVNTKETLGKIILAKENKLRITCDVTPHHLFLSQEQINGQDTSRVTKDLRHLGGGKLSLRSSDSPDGGENNIKNFYSVKPPFGNKTDQEFLWQNLRYIDCIASDHAPHTVEEKKSDNPPSGMPGLETMLPLLITAVNDRRLELDDVIRLTNTNPQKIFGIKQDENTYVEVDLDEKYQIKNEDLKTKCGWSPFSGWEVYGRIQKVFIRGTKVFEDGKILISPSFGEQILNRPLIKKRQHII